MVSREKEMIWDRVRKGDDGMGRGDSRTQRSLNP